TEAALGRWNTGVFDRLDRLVYSTFMSAMEASGRAVFGSWIASGAMALTLTTLACGPTNPPGTGGTGGAGGSSGSSGSNQCFGMELPPRARAYSAPGPASLEPYAVSGGFRTAEPAAAGFDPAKLEAALSFTIPQATTKGILVLRKGYIVAERYMNGFTATTRQESYSVAKGFTSALMGIAINQGLIPNPDHRACNAYPVEWPCANTSDPRSRITVRHLMNLQAGFQWKEDWRSTANFLENDTIRGGANLIDFALPRPSVAEPGTVQRYSTADPALLSGVLQGAAGRTALDYARQVLFGPLGITNVSWSSDPKGRTTTQAGLQLTMRDYAKFGYLYLRGGKWDNTQIVPQPWVDLTTKRVDVCQDRYRYLWHTNPPIRLGSYDPACSDFPNCVPRTLTDLPADGFFAEGVFGQFIFIFPSADLVVVRLAQDQMGSEFWDDYARGFMTRVFDAITS
ncbi:MAG TPA: serine hydrolase, partial [Polyangiaceae bacterium]|nr:serine hydrolase [Polyangiaceae bacterium]